MTHIRRLLIANRGEISRRIIRTANRMGLATVAVYSPADAHALHVREAGAAIALGGNSATESYLCVGQLIAAARASGADAVHPGYGFLSENADFAQAVIGAGLTWVGPPPAAMRQLGNKASARQLAQALGVPTLPGYQGEDQSDQRFLAEAARIGYPVMVKAVAGGGGRGMRLVTDASQLSAALASARSEAQAAFGFRELLLERALLAPRHIEVQVFADSHGRCIHLGERDCSVQRRHQKLIEETPSPAVNAGLRERLADCAIRLVQAAGYVGAGTVEFLLDGSCGGDEDAQCPHPKLPPDGEGARAFFMMEVNTRLQVEHPVTEAVTGIDLVEWQLRVAQGEPLPLTQEQVRFAGHAIEVRLCAEDEDFHPHTGVIRQFRPPSRGEGLRFDHAIHERLVVSPFYDSLLGKLIAHAATREAAIAQLAAALDDTQVLGLATNRRLLAACLRHPQFRAGRALIPFLADEGDALRAQLHDAERAAAESAALAAVYGLRRGASLPPPFTRPLRLRHRGELLSLRVRELADGALEVQHERKPERVTQPPAVCVRLDDGRWHVQLGAVDLIVQDASFEPAGRDSGAGADELRAPFNGKVIAVQAQAGRAVTRGETLLVLESMKLEHALAAVRDGVIETVQAVPGQQTATGQVLVTFLAAGSAKS